MSTSEHIFAEGDIVIAYGSGNEQERIWVGVVIGHTGTGNPRVKFWNEYAKDFVKTALVMQPHGLTFIGRAPEDG